MKQNTMRKSKYLFASAFLCGMLAGCGKQNVDVVDLSDFSAISDGSDEEAMMPQYTADELLEGYGEEDYRICFANLTGKDLEDMRISFSDSQIQGLPILNEGEVFSDGESYVYEADLLAQVWHAEHLKLSITATAVDDETLVFDAVTVWGLDGACVVLTSSADGYYLYME